MRVVNWTDEHGYKRQSLIRDDDPDEAAPSGIQLGPPPLDGLDWEAVKRDLHNRLFDAGLFTWADVQQGAGLRGAILSALRKKLIYLYREAENHG